jgi:tetratricopeptide (TPR) repeat protein
MRWRPCCCSCFCGGRRGRAGASLACLFALHPLHVESVAWVAERKDVLSACFWFFTLWSYVRYTEQPGASRYLVVALGLCLGLMAKPTVVTLPLVLLSLDYWPLGRLEAGWRKALGEKLPLIGLSVAASVITYLVQEQGGAVKALPLDARLANATHSCTLYIFKTLCPSQLAVFYPFPTNYAFAPLLAEGILLAVVTAGVIVLRRHLPYLFTGWGWSAITLVPVIGLVQVGVQTRADRYMYIPMVGLLIMVIWGAAEILEKWRTRRLAACLAVAACRVCAVLSWVQIGYWRNSETLFRHALEVTGDNSVADISLGKYLMASQGRMSGALPYLETAARIDPDSEIAHSEFGIALAKAGRITDAIEQFQAAVRLDPDSPIPQSDLGSALIRAGRLPDAIAELESAARINPNDASVQRNLGAALADTGRLPEALPHLEKAERLRPDPKLERAIAEMQARLR